MVLSVIIVNYRVKYFLELCLFSVQKALQGLDAEILVADNHSGDESLAYLVPRFPGIRFIANTANIGFARANNQALELAKGKYILFLNPDTILPEDFINRCLSFLEGQTRQEQVGAVGFRMVDGSGRFLKESRRGFPTPWVAFCKLTGLTALFPHTKAFAGYYLGQIPPTVTHRSPILSGACMWVSRSVLQEVGSFDEQFFMYAEDIDLSHRIEKAGYHNYYLADTTIVHFKGESTKKDARYTRLFYKAMSQFRRKYSRGGLSGMFNGLVEIAIWARMGVSAISAFGRSIGKETPNSPATMIRSWLTGDQEGMDRLQALLETAERSLVPDLQQSNEVIFCEGDRFSFKEAIAALQTTDLYTGGRQAKFFARGSGSVTGSASKDGRGETIVL
jgi:N-acetylglucosaminyl-diphospho-decaprenol L-rhamnosyltransferase